MSYQRVAPRDIFSEANFLKCLGRLALIAHDFPNKGIRFNNDRYLDEQITFFQDENTGNLYIDSEWFSTASGKPLIICRPLNSRDEWPIFWIGDEGENVYFFYDSGELINTFE